MTPVNQNTVHAAERLLDATYDTDGGLTEDHILETLRVIGKSDMYHKDQLLLTYKRLALQALSEQRAVVVSAQELSKSDQQEILSAISKKHPEVRSVDWQLNAQLLGGITVLVADQWYDFSIRQQLTTIRERLSV